MRAEFHIARVVATFILLIGPVHAQLTGPVLDGSITGPPRGVLLPRLPGQEKVPMMIPFPVDTAGRSAVEPGPHTLRHAVDPDHYTLAHNDLNRRLLAGLGAWAPAVILGTVATMGNLKPLVSSRLGNALLTRAAPPFLGAVVVPVILQLTTTGRVDWGKILPFAGGAALAMLLFNPVTMPGALLATAMGGLTGEAIYQLWRDWMSRPREPSAERP